MALTDKLSAIGNAIRAKTGKTDKLTLDQMPGEIAGITGGGGGGANPDANDPVYYVTFMNGNQKLYVRPVVRGENCTDVVANNIIPTPTKESDVQYSYTFYGWGASDGGAANSSILNNITEDKTVYAIFSSTLQTYTITYLDDDGSVLKTETLTYGTMPNYVPAKTDYEFIEWTPTLTSVTGDASYIASWKESEYLVLVPMQELTFKSTAYGRYAILDDIIEPLIEGATYRVTFTGTNNSSSGEYVRTHSPGSYYIMYGSAAASYTGYGNPWVIDTYNSSKANITSVKDHDTGNAVPNDGVAYFVRPTTDSNGINHLTIHVKLANTYSHKIKVERIL